MNSPLMYRRFGVDMDDPYFNNYGDDMDVNVEHPRTPRTTFEPILNSGNRSIVSARASPNKKRKRIRLAKYDGDDSDVYGDDYDEDDENDGDGDGDGDDDDDDYGSGDEGKVRISRLPTSSARLTSVDLVIHLLQSSSAFRCKALVGATVEHLLDILDLNMVNNHYSYKIQDLQNEKKSLRREILRVREEVSRKSSQLEQQRLRYSRLRKLLCAKWRFNGKLETTKTQVRPQILERLNRLNNVYDPHWNLVTRLSLLNEKLQELDQQSQ